jgi:hypothetical protein
MQLFNYEKQAIDKEINFAKKQKRYNKNFKLPATFLVILYHGKDNYKGSIELRDEFFQIKGIDQSFLLNQKIFVADLSKKEKTDLPHNPEAPELYVALRLMQIITNENIDSLLQDDDIFSILEPHIQDPEIRNFVRLCAYYVLDSNRKLTETGQEQFKQKILNLLKGDEDMWSPIAKRYMAQGEARGEARGEANGEARGFARGKAEGKAEGIVEGKAEVIVDAILSILDIKFGEIFETVQEPLKKIMDINSLDELVRFAQKCDTFDEFYKKLKSIKKS